MLSPVAGRRGTGIPRGVMSPSSMGWGRGWTSIRWNPLADQRVGEQQAGPDAQPVGALHQLEHQQRGVAGESQRIVSRARRSPGR